MSEPLKAAICQMLISDDKNDNLSHAGEMIYEASKRQAQMIILPEIFNGPYQTELMAENAEIFPGKTTSFLSDLSRKNKIILVGGSIPEKDEAGKIYNSSYVFDEQGNLIGKHRKMHLFDIDIPEQIYFKESDVFTAGNSLQIIRHKDLTFAVIICYDIRFPELARLAALEGAQLLIVPAAFNLTTGPAHWELLIRTRAVDNQLFVIAASPALNPEASYHAWGHSMAADPWGTVINEGKTGEEIIYVQLDLSIINKVRRELPLIQHRRNDIYQFNYQENHNE